MDEYITNINTDDIGDEELLNKLKKVEAELSETKSKLDEKSKLCLEQKHQLEDLFIETKDLKEKYNHQKNLIQFYEEKASNDTSAEVETDPDKKDKIKQLEIKIMNLNEKVRELEESIIKKDNELEVVKQELEEEKEISNKALDMINEKEDEINELKEKLEKVEQTEKSDFKRKISTEELNSEEVQTLKEVFLSQQEEYELYKETTEKKLKNYASENNELCNQIKELKDKIAQIEADNLKLKERNEYLEKEKKISDAKLEENKENEDIQVNDYINEIQQLQTQIEENERKNKELLDKQKENAKHERNEYEKIISDLTKNNTNLLKELETAKDEISKKENELKLKAAERNSTLNAETDLKINMDLLENKMKEKEKELNDIKKQLADKESETKKILEEKDKIINENKNKYEKENNNYAKKIRDLTSQLNTVTTQLNEIKSKNTGATLDQMLDDPTSLLEDQLDESKKTIEKLKEEIKYYEKQIEELKQGEALAKKAQELEAKNKFLSNNIETMTKNIEELKNQKKKSEDDFKKEIDRIESNLGDIKLQLATAVYEKEMLGTKYRRYIDKLKAKLTSLGFKFKEKGTPI